MIVLAGIHEMEGPFHRSENGYSGSTSQRFYKAWFKKRFTKQAWKVLTIRTVTGARGSARRYENRFRNHHTTKHAQVHAGVH